MAEESFLDLKGRLLLRDDDAARDIFERYSSRLVALARSRLSPQLREKLDPEDVAQSVFKSFFTRQAEGQIELVNWDSLWGLLALLTIRKCARRAEYFQADRRNIQREASPSPNSEDNSMGWKIVSTEPTPEQAVVLSETIARLMEDLSEREREMLSQSLQGYTPDEVANAVGCSARTVRRLLQSIRDRLSEMNVDE